MMLFKKCFQSIACITFFLILVVASAFSQEQCTEIYGDSPNKLSLATGSPGDLGIIKALAVAFSKEKRISLCWIKAGSGEALRLLKEKKVDMVMVHAPEAEKQAVAEGWATKRTLVGSNEFFIVGPQDDPAKVSGAQNAVEAYRRISNAEKKFFSRGDNSGTHKKEMDIWRKAGISPSGDWYIVTKDFMKATLKRAHDEKGYFMTDSSTWVAEKKNVPDLKILLKGDAMLVNTYHALCQAGGATSGASVAEQFTDFIASEKGQKIIRDFGKDLYGEGLYNDATYAKQYE
jgi:tungstate transport system substrate-binding protein